MKRMGIPLHWSILFMLFICMLSCQRSDEEKDRLSDQEELDSGSPLSSKALGSFSERVDSNFTFIRTAEAKFRVKSVWEATHAIENIVLKHQGFLESTNLGSHIIEEEIIPIQADSSLEIRNFSLTNQMVVKIPHENLSAFMNEAGAFVDFIDYRIVHAQDIRADLLSSQLAQNRLRKSAAQWTPAQQKNITDKNVLQANDQFLQQQTAADEQTVQQLRWSQSVQYSKVELHLYQSPQITKTMIVGKNWRDAYSPPFFEKWKLALLDGWQSLGELLLIPFRYWSYILIAFLLYRLVLRVRY